jgi:toxin ParE1/3/4
MSSYSLTRSARRDLDGIWDYIAHDSVVQADRLIDWLTTKFENLGDNPYLGGRWRPRRPLRAFSAKKFTIFYVPVAGGVEIRRVFRGGLDLDALDFD